MDIQWRLEKWRGSTWVNRKNPGKCGSRTGNFFGVYPLFSHDRNDDKYGISWDPDLRDDQINLHKTPHLGWGSWAKKTPERCVSYASLATVHVLPRHCSCRHFGMNGWTSSHSIRIRIGFQWFQVQIWIGALVPKCVLAKLANIITAIARYEYDIPMKTIENSPLFILKLPFSITFSWYA